MVHFHGNGGRRKRSGIVFALDAAIAVTVVIIVLINSTYYFSTASKESLSQMQLMRLGGDSLALIDANGRFDGLVLTDANDTGSFINDTNILNLSRYVPAGYRSFIEITNLHENIINKTTAKRYGAGSLPSCGNTYCEMKSGNAFNISTSPIERTGDYYVQVNLGPLPTEPPPNANAVPLDVELIGTGEAVGDKINMSGPWIFTQPLTLREGVNNLGFKVTSFGNNRINLTWMRIIGSEAYTKETCFQASCPVAIPTDRFVGVVERPIVVRIGEREVSPHVVRGYTWLQ